MHSGPEEIAAANVATTSPWRLGRVDLRSAVAANAWPVARLELEHAERGRVTDIGSAPGAFDAAFVAASHILGIAPTLRSFNVRSGERGLNDALSIVVEIEIELDDQVFGGAHHGLDLVECSLHAWLDAAHKAMAVRS